MLLILGISESVLELIASRSFSLSKQIIAKSALSAINNRILIVSEFNFFPTRQYGSERVKYPERERETENYYQIEEYARTSRKNFIVSKNVLSISREESSSRSSVLQQYNRATLDNASAKKIYTLHKSGCFINQARLHISIIQLSRFSPQFLFLPNFKDASAG